MDLAKTFGIVLREYRVKKGLTQESLADAAGLHRTYISLVERGKRIPTLDVLFRLATCLQTKPSVLLHPLESDQTIAKDR